MAWLFEQFILDLIRTKTLFQNIFLSQYVDFYNCAEFTYCEKDNIYIYIYCIKYFSCLGNALPTFNLSMIKNIKRCKKNNNAKANKFHAEVICFYFLKIRGNKLLSVCSRSDV